MLMAFLLRRTNQKAWHRFFLLYISFILVIPALPFFCNQTACAANVTLEWDPNPEPDIAGYEIFYGLSSRSYSEMIDVGNYTSCTIGGLELGVTYYLAAKAYNTAGYRSDYSDEVRFTLGEPSQDPPPADDDDPEPGQSNDVSSGERGSPDILGGCFIQTSIEGSLINTKAILTKYSSLFTSIFCGLASECRAAI